MIIVTGGAGFIGSNIINLLNRQGINEIIVVDNISSSNKYLNLSKAAFVDYIDKIDFLSFLPKIGKIDMIIHQGACSSTTETDGNYMIRNNFEYSKELLHYCLKNKTKFIYASSASVYGSGKKGFKEIKSNEAPLNVYAFSKFLFDNYVRQALKREDGIPITGLRYFNVFGYQENHKGAMASVPYHFYQQIKEGNKLMLFEGSKDFLRDFIFIEDVVNVVNFFINNDISGIYNCGTGQARSFLDIANIIKRMYNDVAIEFIPFPSHLKGKYQEYTQADINSLKSVGYNKDFFSLEKSLEKYYNKFEETNGYI